MFGGKGVAQSLRQVVKRIAANCFNEGNRVKQSQDSGKTAESETTLRRNRKNLK